MKTLRLLALMTVASVFVFAAVAAAEDAPAAAPAAKPAVHETVGTATCKMCHSGPTHGAIYETWEKTKHAKAFANLPADQKTDEKCFVCHTTNYGKPGGYDPKSPNAAKLEGVGCESCHGGGKDYKASSVMKDPAKAKAAGLIMPDAATCKGCHEGATPEGHKELPKFDFATMYKQIEHHAKPVEPAK
jgi:hypothetical protein